MNVSDCGRLTTLKSALTSINIYETKPSIIFVGYDIELDLYRILEIKRSVLQCNDTLDMKTYSTSFTKDTLDARLAKLEAMYGALKLIHSNVKVIFGFIKLVQSFYAIIIKDISEVASIHGNCIYTPTSVDYIPITWNLDTSSKEAKYMHILKGIDLTSNFYFSFTYDLTSTFQKNNLKSSQGGYLDCVDMFAWNAFALKPILDAIDHEEVQTSAYRNTIIRNSNEVSSETLTQPKTMKGGMGSREDTERSINGLLPWIVPVIYGYVDEKIFNLHNSHSRLRYVLVSRRSRKFAGTRLLRRGINDAGSTANEVETEQIITKEIGVSTIGEVWKYRSSSLVQVRGSIPLFWSHDNLYAMKPGVVLEPMDEAKLATKRHFANLFHRYGNHVTIISLLRMVKNKQEIKLGEEYKKVMTQLSGDGKNIHKMKKKERRASAYSLMLKRRQSLSNNSRDSHDTYGDVNDQSILSSYGSTKGTRSMSSTNDLDLEQDGQFPIEYIGYDFLHGKNVFNTMHEISKEVFTKSGFFVQPLDEYCSIEDYEVTVGREWSPQLYNLICESNAQGSLPYQKKHEDNTTRSRTRSRSRDNGNEIANTMDGLNRTNSSSSNIANTMDGLNRTNSSSSNIANTMDGLNRTNSSSSTISNLQMSKFDVIPEDSEEDGDGDDDDDDLIGQTDRGSMASEGNTYDMRNSDTHSGNDTNLYSSNIRSKGISPSSDIYSTINKKESYFSYFNKMLGEGLRGGLLQRGIVRTNCVDCLDRTNVGQFCYARECLPMQLKSIGIYLTESSLQNFVHGFIEIWSKNGDLMAHQYAGSGAMHKLESAPTSPSNNTSSNSNNTNTQSIEDNEEDVSERTVVLASGVGNKLEAVKRYYSNISTDFERQHSIDLLLGIMEPVPGDDLKTTRPEELRDTKGKRKSDTHQVLSWEHTGIRDTLGDLVLNPREFMMSIPKILLVEANTPSVSGELVDKRSNDINNINMRYQIDKQYISDMTSFDTLLRIGAVASNSNNNSNPSSRSRGSIANNTLIWSAYPADDDKYFSINSSSSSSSSSNIALLNDDIDDDDDDNDGQKLSNMYKNYVSLETLLPKKKDYSSAKEKQKQKIRERTDSNLSTTRRNRMHRPDSEVVEEFVGEPVDTEIIGLLLKRGEKVEYDDDSGDDSGEDTEDNFDYDDGASNTIFRTLWQDNSVSDKSDDGINKNVDENDSPKRTSKNKLFRVPKFLKPKSKKKVIE